MRYVHIIICNYSYTHNRLSFVLFSKFELNIPISYIDKRTHSHTHPYAVHINKILNSYRLFRIRLYVLRVGISYITSKLNLTRAHAVASPLPSPSKSPPPSMIRKFSCLLLKSFSLLLIFQLLLLCYLPHPIYFIRI